MRSFDVLQETIVATEQEGQSLALKQGFRQAESLEKEASRKTMATGLVLGEDFPRMLSVCLSDLLAGGELRLCIGQLSCCLTCV